MKPSRLVTFFHPLMFGLVMACGTAHAQAVVDDVQTESETATRSAQPDLSYTTHLAYDIDAEGRVTYTAEVNTRILRENVLESAKTKGVSYSRGIQEAEILEAYTLKADGRHIDVPADNYQTNSRGGRNGGNPFFSDEESMTVVFPDLALGDSTHLLYRIRDKVAIFPGAFSFRHGFSPFMAIEETTLTVRAPENMALTLEAHHLEALPVTTGDGVITRQWRYQNPTPRVWEYSKDSGIWRSGDSPALRVSTFSSYEVIAQAYGERALPKAEPTPRIRELAATIVGEEKAPREQARLLYEWVSTQISYAGNCIGVGMVVPRDLDVVLDNKMGDCKDQATLLQALLAAQNIASEQVLMNAGSNYDLPKTPTVGAINHVINYLPEWRLYVDATASKIPFAYLPYGSYGKPVIHVGVADAVRTITKNNSRDIQKRIQTTLKLSADGSASGQAHIRVKGVEVAAMREYFMNMRPEQREKYVENVLSRQDLRGKGTLVLGDLAPEKRLSDELEFDVSFQIDKFLRSNSGAFVLAALFSGGATLNGLSEVDDSREVTRDQICWQNVDVSESYDITLEPGVRFTHLPEPFTRNTAYFDFKSSVKRTRNGAQNKVKIERTFADKAPSGICSAAYQNALVKAVIPVAENLQQQVIYIRSAKGQKTGNR